MAGGSNGYRAALARRTPTPGLILSSPGTVELPPSISFSTSYPERDFARRISLEPSAAGRRLIARRAQPALRPKDIDRTEADQFAGAAFAIDPRSLENRLSRLNAPAPKAAI
jgi:hypothetical protein